MKTTVESFPAIVDARARVLILGSMPGAESLRLDRYYANPRNAFWMIMARMYDFSQSAAYEDKIAALSDNNIALWDVIRSCRRSGSLDANIEQGSIRTNDFVSLFREYRRIDKICFNGARAEAEYLKRVLPQLSGRAAAIEHVRLPSTSPAMAAMSLEDKVASWSRAIMHG